MPIVVIADTTQGLEPAIEAIFAPHGGVEAVIPKDSSTATVYVKPNGVHFTPHTHTDPAVLEAVLAYLRDHGYTRLAVMESSTGGNFTRLVFKVTGYARICHRYGAEPVYLDEGPTVQVELCDGTRARIPAASTTRSSTGAPPLRQALRPAQGKAQGVVSTSACPSSRPTRWRR